MHVAGSVAVWSSLLPPSRLRRLALAAGGVVLVAIVGHAVGLSETTAAGTGRLGGDLPGFLGAARIVARGEFALLYDPAAQAAAQADLLPPGAGFVRYAYPPVVAAAYVPLLALPLRAAVLAHAALGALLVALATTRMITGWRRLAGWGASAACAALGFYPLFRAVGGGQNTPLSLLLLVGAATSGGPVAAGALLGALAFKPTLAIPALVAVVAARPRAVLGAAPVLAVGWALNALILGPAWLSPWLRAGLAFQVEDAVVDAPNSVSLVDLAGGIGAGGAVVLLVGGLALVAVARRLRGDVPRLCAFVAAVSPLLAPHALYYDAGLLVLPLGLLAARVGYGALPVLLGAWLGAAAAFVLPPGPTLAGVCLAVGAATLSPLAGPPRPIDTARARR